MSCLFYNVRSYKINVNYSILIAATYQPTFGTQFLNKLLSSFDVVAFPGCHTLKVDFDEILRAQAVILQIPICGVKASTKIDNLTLTFG